MSSFRRELALLSKITLSVCSTTLSEFPVPLLWSHSVFADLKTTSPTSEVTHLQSCYTFKLSLSRAISQVWSHFCSCFPSFSVSVFRMTTRNEHIISVMASLVPPLLPPNQQHPRVTPALMSPLCLHSHLSGVPVPTSPAACSCPVGTLPLICTPVVGIQPSGQSFGELGWQTNKRGKRQWKGRPQLLAAP